MVRVLVVDDSVSSRELLSSVLVRDPDLQVSGLARNGRDAVRQVEKQRPDVVVMDLYMPGMDGLEATHEIMQASPTPILIVSGVLSDGKVGLADEALRAGAMAVLPKPNGPDAPEFDREAAELAMTVKALASVKTVRHHRRRPGENAPTAAADSNSTRRKRTAVQPIVAVAASAGGPAALTAILNELPQDFGAPILLVQHIVPDFVQGFAEILQGGCALPVHLATDGGKAEPGNVYVAPDQVHLGVRRPGVLALFDGPPVDGFRPAATRLFDSVAEIYGDSAIALVLTGMGRDGVAGLRNVRARGGYVVAQDRQTSLVYGMPGEAVAAGVVDEVLPLQRIAGALVDRIREMTV
jgi:two-component system chemotaxis response regulator CheB